MVIIIYLFNTSVPVNQDLIFYLKHIQEMFVYTIFQWIFKGCVIKKFTFKN